MGETLRKGRHPWSWVERKQRDIAPVEIWFCLNLHLLWTFPACPPFPLAFWIPSLSSVGKRWQQTAARDRIQEVAPCSKPDVWQQNMDEEAERKGAGTDNLEQLGERNAGGAVCPMPMTREAEGRELYEAELWYQEGPPCAAGVDVMAVQEPSGHLTPTYCIICLKRGGSEERHFLTGILPKQKNNTSP